MIQLSEILGKIIALCSRAQSVKVNLNQRFHVYLWLALYCALTVLDKYTYVGRHYGLTLQMRKLRVREHN